MFRNGEPRTWRNITGFASGLPPGSNIPLALAFGLCRANVRVKIVSKLANMGHLDRVSREIVVRGEWHNTLGLSLNNQD